MDNPIPRIDPEFKELIPPLSQEEYNQLEQNIKANKQCRDALVIWDGILVDGHNRLRICATHSIPFEIKEMSFPSREVAKLWILNNQLGRRNLSDAMRIELAISKTELLRKKAKENQSRAGGDKSVNTGAGALFSKVSKPIEEPINIHKTVASEAGVSDGTVHNYLQIAKQGSPKLLEDVKSGKLKIGTAHRLLNAHIIKQLKHADKLYGYIEKNLPVKNNPKANQEIKERLMGLMEKLEALKEAYNA